MPSNVNAARGFSVHSHLSGGLPNRLSRHHIASGLASNLYRGDACIPTNTSKNIDRPGTGAVRLLGVFDGCYYIDSNGDTQYRPRWATGTVPLTGSTVDAWVYDDPNLLFEIQADEDIVAADIGAFADITLGTGNNLTGVSGDQLDSSQIGSGANLKLIDTVPRADNYLGVNYTKCIVAIALHYLAGAKTAI